MNAMSTQHEIATDSSAHVLVVDDEAIQRETLGATLEDAGYVVTLAENAAEAIDLLEREQIQVLCTDFQMPGMNGLELADRARGVSPGTVSVLVTGYPDYVMESDRSPGSSRPMLLVKPYHPDDVLRILAQAVRFSRIRGAIDGLSDEAGASGA